MTAYTPAPARSPLAPLRPHPARIAPRYRAPLALLAFTALYILIPLAFIFGIYALNATTTAQADRAHASYTLIAPLQ